LASLANTIEELDGETPSKQDATREKREGRYLKKKLIEVALPLEAIIRAREIHPAWSSIYAASLVGAPSACGMPGCALRVFGRRSGFAARPVSD
jgi:hypothetical protein